MDDEDSKVRRNLVVASALVLLLVWLKLPLADVAERLLGTKSSATLQIDAARVWSAVVVVLVYFALRFGFSEAVEKAGEKIGTASLLARASLIEVIVRWELMLFNKFRKVSPVFGVNLVGHLDKQTDEMRLELNRHPVGSTVGTELVKAAVYFSGFEDSIEQWSGAIRVKYFWTTSKHGSARSTGETVPWHLRGVRRWFVVVVAFLRVVLLSQVGLSLLYPLALFVLALLTSVTMLWRAL